MLSFSAMRYGAVALVSFLLSSPSPTLALNDPEGQSTFTSPGGEVSFGFTVAERAAGVDTFFTLRVPIGVSWGAVGLGSAVMDRALVLMIYMNADGTNVTFSPRYGQGNFEPAWLDEFAYEVLDGTGLVRQSDGKDYMLFRARCTQGCRSWHNGHLDASSPSVEAIYAFGPSVPFGSNNPKAPLQYHVEHGRFQIDAKRTEGLPDAPVIDGPLSDVPTDGTTFVQDSRVTGLRDAKVIAHGCLMIAGALITYPAGVYLLKKKGFAWHAVVQMVGSLFMLIGFGLGVATSLWYQRSRNFRNKHQIIGFIVIAGIIVQPVLGILHHRQFLQTQKKGRLSLAHRSIGLVVIFFSILNILFGFSLAQNYIGGRVLGGIIFVLCLSFLAVRFFFIYRKRRQARPTYPVYSTAQAGASPQQPWRQNPPPSGMDGFGDNYGRQEAPPPQYDIGLTSVGSSTPSKEADGGGLGGATQPGADLTLSGAGRSRGDAGIGPAQTPREFM